MAAHLGRESTTRRRRAVGAGGRGETASARSTFTLDYLIGVGGGLAPTPLLLMQSLREGLSPAVIGRLEEAGVERRYRVAIIPERTLQHRISKGERMTPAESERALRIARVIAQADEVFGTHDKALRWLHTPMRRLEQQTPLDVLDTDVGARLVEEALAQIDEGYFA